MGVSLAGTSEAREELSGTAVSPTGRSTSFGCPDRTGAGDADGLCELDSALCEVRIIDFGRKALWCLHLSTDRSLFGLVSMLVSVKLALHFSQHVAVPC